MRACVVCVCVRACLAVCRACMCSRRFAWYGCFAGKIKRFGAPCDWSTAEEPVYFHTQEPKLEVGVGCQCPTAGAPGGIRGRASVSVVRVRHRDELVFVCARDRERVFVCPCAPAWLCPYVSSEIGYLLRGLMVWVRLVAEHGGALRCPWLGAHILWPGPRHGQKAGH